MMTPRVRVPYRTVLVAAAGTAAALAGAGLPAALAAAPPAHSPGVQAQGTGMRLTQPITDEAGILTPADESAIQDAINRLQDEEQLTLRVVYLDTFGGQTPQQFAEATVTASGGSNIGVFAVAIEDRQYGLQGGTQWSPRELDAFDQGALSALQNSDFAAAPVAGVDAITGGGAGGTGSDDGGGAWLAAGGAGLAAAGGGAWWYTRRQNNKRTRDSLRQSRQLDPADTRSIAALPVATLAQRAEEVIVATDESVRNAQEELQIATAEFGPERTRAFLKALNTANSALQKAYQTRAKLNDSIPESEQEKRALYTEIISSCGQAEQALDEQSEKFTQLRDLLIHSSAKLDELTQRTVDLRARLAPAGDTLERLRGEYSPEVLDSINDNPDMAGVALDEAEKALSAARELENRPAGEQAGLIDAIRETERAVNLADDLLTGVEHADTNIATAKAQLPALIDEVEEEIAEAAHLKNRGQAEGARVDWSALEVAVTNARSELDRARTNGQRDPLGAYADLMDADSKLDDALDSAREGTRDQSRKLAMFDQQLATAQSQIQGAEDLIASRGRIIGSEARTHLAEAKRLAAQAQQLRTSDTRAGNEFARASSVAAQRAAVAAKNDIDRYRQRQNYHRHGGRSSGDMITGMVLGSLLSGGGRGGFGGGFGGGGFGGGGFSGGGGGGFRGGGF